MVKVETGRSVKVHSNPNCAVILWLEGTSRRHLVQPSLKLGHPKQVAQDHIEEGFKDLQRWRLHHLSVQPILYTGTFLLNIWIGKLATCSIR